MINNIAVVIGGSMAGLLAARALSDQFEAVLILERDKIADEPSLRKGTPQGSHVHLMLKRGTEILENYFPGFYDNLDAHPADISKDIHLYHLNEWPMPAESDDLTYSMSRSLLENSVRNRVHAISNIRFIDNVSVSKLCIDAEDNRVSGIVFEDRTTNREETLPCGLVVDATGRGSRLPQWLQMAGYPEIEESELVINMRYATRTYEAAEGYNPDWTLLAIYPTAPSKRTGLIGKIEGNRYVVTLTGKLGDMPPTDEAEFLEYARQFPQPEIYDFLRQATPVSDFSTHHTPSNRRRHYEKLAGFPDGLAVIGDAICSFNPVWGQGMTTAALESLELAKAVEKFAKEDGVGEGFGTYYHKQIAKVIDVPWTAATTEDMRHPEIGVDVPLIARFTNWYVKQIHDVTAYDGQMNIFYMRMMSMMLPPTAAFSPKVIFKVMRHLLTHRNHAENKSETSIRSTNTMPAFKQS